MIFLYSFIILLSITKNIGLTPWRHSDASLPLPKANAETILYARSASKSFQIILLSPHESHSARTALAYHRKRMMPFDIASIILMICAA